MVSVAAALTELMEREELVRPELTLALWLEVIGQRVPAKQAYLNRRRFQAGREAAQPLWTPTRPTKGARRRSAFLWQMLWRSSSPI